MVGASSGRLGSLAAVTGVSNLSEELCRQIVQQVSDARSVVADVEHNQDFRGALASLSSGDEWLHDLADLRGGHRRDIGAALRSAKASERIGEAVGR